MKAIPLSEQQRVESDAPGFAQAVKRAKDIRATVGSPVPVLATLKEFYDNPVLLYWSLWYANSEGVSVTFEPTVPSRQPKKK